MRSLLDDLAVVDDDYIVRITDGGETVGDDALDQARDGKVHQDDKGEQYKRENTPLPVGLDEGKWFSDVFHVSLMYLFQVYQTTSSTDSIFLTELTKKIFVQFFNPSTCITLSST